MSGSQTPALTVVDGSVVDVEYLYTRLIEGECIPKVMIRHLIRERVPSYDWMRTEVVIFSLRDVRDGSLGDILDIGIFKKFVSRYRFIEPYIVSSSEVYFGIIIERVPPVGMRHLKRELETFVGHKCAKVHFLSP